MKAEVLFLCCLALLGLAAAAVERATGVTFLETSGMTSLQLAGTGVRAKGPIKVYAVGMHIPRSQVAAKVKALKPKTANDVEKELPKLISEAHITLKMVREVAATTMASALSDAVAPRMQGRDAAACKSFEKLILAGGACKKGQEIKFFCSKSAVGVSINGKKQGDVSSAALSKALIGTYTDKGAVSGSLKSSLAATLLTWA